MTSYQHLYNTIMSRPLTDDTYSERAYSVLHAAYPQANLAQINEAATTDWCNSLSDDREEIVAMAHIDEHMKVKFFTEDDSVSDIKAFGDISPEFNSAR